MGIHWIRNSERRGLQKKNKKRSRQKTDGPRGKKGKAMERKEMDKKKQKQMSLNHHLSGKGFCNAWTPSQLNTRALNWYNHGLKFYRHLSQLKFLLSKSWSDFSGPNPKLTQNLQTSLSHHFHVFFPHLLLSHLGIHLVWARPQEQDTCNQWA